MWADGIHLKVRLAQDKVCLLVIVGVRADGTKELVALDDGHRESTESWSDLLRSCKRRGLRAPVLAVGDGALGFWAALRDVFPETREQRCWFHKIANVLRLPGRALDPLAHHEPDRVHLRHGHRRVVVQGSPATRRCVRQRSPRLTLERPCHTFNVFVK